MSYLNPIEHTYFDNIINANAPDNPGSTKNLGLAFHTTAPINDSTTMGYFVGGDIEMLKAIHQLTKREEELKNA